ncbi:hypothetical protein DFJ73DRAFT_847303 [Zopfochytrium polystomum]|nr:hypothetical protein DFJ73DRAFT_847303 [Zopfochytrium polystomum]
MRQLHVVHHPLRAPAPHPDALKHPHRLHHMPREPVRGPGLPQELRLLAALAHPAYDHHDDAHARDAVLLERAGQRREQHHARRNLPGRLQDELRLFRLAPHHQPRAGRLACGARLCSEASRSLPHRPLKFPRSTRAARTFGPRQRAPSRCHQRRSLLPVQRNECNFRDQPVQVVRKLPSPWDFCRPTWRNSIQTHCPAAGTHGPASLKGTLRCAFLP